ncbi:hypothetical protein BH09BAC3_BH09BAC3_03550 [soil metagenome]
MRFIILLIFPSSLFAQFTYTVDRSIPVEVDGKAILNPWAGGLNSPQVNTMDLNGDGKPDLVIFDKTTSKINTFLAGDNVYNYAPEYEILFPLDITVFVVLMDFNCDGKKDLFTFGNIGIFVYKNVTQPGQQLTWKKLTFYTGPGLKSEVLLTTGLSGSKINLLPGTNDLPSFVDMDGDGDMDVLNMRFISPSQAEYHRNFSVENNHGCDSLELVKQPSNYGYGSFTECSCGKIAFGTQTCADIGGRVDQTQHSGGKSLLSIDMDNDGDKDIVYSEETCSSLYYMENKGDSQNAIMNGFTLFPSTNPVSLLLYPAVYSVDVDFDGKADLLSAPNLYARSASNNNFTQSLLYYKNIGTNQLPNFSFVKNNFLQEGMIDVGDFSAPAFVDIDQDGDEDLFIGNYLTAGSTGWISFYENTGTSNAPTFKLITPDYLSISALFLSNIKPQFIDVDKNGGPDLVFTATRSQNGVTSIFYVLSTSSTSPSFGGQTVQAFNFTMSTNDNVTLIDIDQDGRLDLLRGKSTGSLEYWRGTSNTTFSLANSKYLGLGESLDRQYITAVGGDIDNDGREDLIVGNQAGTISVFGDFRSAGANALPVTNILYDTFSKSYKSKNLGGRLKPVIANLYGTDKPEIIVGNTQGGLQILKNDNGQILADRPVITVFPNPLPANGTLSIQSDRNAIMDVYTVLGKRIGTSFFTPGSQIVTYPFQGVAAGVYIARFTAGTKTVSVRFIVL